MVHTVVAHIVEVVHLAVNHTCLKDKSEKFLLDIGQMSHPVGGAMSVTLSCTDVERDTPSLKWLYHLTKYL